MDERDVYDEIIADACHYVMVHDADRRWLAAALRRFAEVHGLRPVTAPSTPPSEPAPIDADKPIDVDAPPTPESPRVATAGTMLTVPDAFLAAERRGMERAAEMADDVSRWLSGKIRGAAADLPVPEVRTVEIDGRKVRAIVLGDV